MQIPDHITKPHWLSVLKRPLSEFDLIGFGLFAPSSVMCFLALQFGGHQYAWSSATVIGLFCGAGATFVVWLSWDYRKGDTAMVPLNLLKKQTVWASCATGLFFAGSLFITGYYLPIYFQAVKGVSPLMSGVDVLPNILPQMFLSIVAGKLGESSAGCLKLVPKHLLTGCRSRTIWILPTLNANLRRPQFHLERSFIPHLTHNIDDSMGRLPSPPWHSPRMRYLNGSLPPYTSP